jgi:hypothetical protein
MAGWAQAGPVAAKVDYTVSGDKSAFAKKPGARRSRGNERQSEK